MLIAGWVLGLALLSFFFSDLLDKQNNPNQHINAVVSTSGVKEVILQRNREGHYLATGKINGQAVEFLLDTGASDVSVPQRVAQRLGLRRGPAAVYGTANGNITSYLTKIDSLNLGGIELHAVRASINPSMDGDTILLGMSFLKHLEFTQRGDTLIIRQYPQQ
jgi:aspartyl protease family protein